MNDIKGLFYLHTQKTVFKNAVFNFTTTLENMD